MPPPLRLAPPVYVTSILGLLRVRGGLGLVPRVRRGDGLRRPARHLTLPALILAALLGAIVVRQTRAAVLDVVSQDYITFARLRGLRRWRILLKYTLRNAAVPVLTSAGLLLIIAITAGLFIEQVFSLPGAGTLLLTAVTDKDIPTVQGLAMALWDPRCRGQPAGRCGGPGPRPPDPVLDQGALS